MEENVSVQPTPSRDERIWAAAVFECKGKTGIIGNRVQLMVNGQATSSLLRKLYTLFGGSLYPFGASQLRWQVSKDDLEKFLQAIEAFVTEDGRELISDIRATEASIPRRGKRGKPVGTNVPKFDAFTLMEGVDPDQMFLVVSGNAENSEGLTILKAKNEEHANQWIHALRAYASVLAVTPHHNIFIHVELAKRERLHG